MNRIDKNSAALIATLVALSVYGLLRMLGFRSVAGLSMVVAALGSDLWTVASQSLWQHGPAALAWTHRGRSFWFAAPFLVVVTAVLGYNIRHFGHLSGGQHELESLHAEFHAVRESWSPHVLAGAAGTLLSPSRGLLIFCPWVAVIVAILPKLVARLRSVPLLSTVLPILLLYGLALSAYSAWWAGHSFGPRYWTEVTPLLAILLAFGLAWSWERCRLAFAALVLTGAMAIVIQMMGAFCYPSSWNQRPINVDQAHWRLWDWRDSELSRSFDECVRARFPLGR